MTIIGREKEIEEFRHLYDSGKAEFVAIYGRRRVGKTSTCTGGYDRILSCKLNADSAIP